MYLSSSTKYFVIYLGTSTSTILKLKYKVQASTRKNVLKQVSTFTDVLGPNPDADDTILFLRNTDEVLLVNKLLKELKSVAGLTLNSDKTEALHIADDFENVSTTQLTK